MLLKTLDEKKKQIDKMRPIPKDLLHNLEKWFEVELTYTSNAIEGNTLTRAETSLVLEKGLTVGGKPLKDHLEATNHRDALIKMRELAQSKKAPKAHDIFSLHECVLHSIDDENAGVLRRVNVRVSGSRVVFPQSHKLSHLLDELESWLSHAQKEHPVFRAAMTHYRLVSIHPFIDGNGRTARLLMNLILIQHGFPPAIIGPKERLKYITSLEKAQLGGELTDYLNLIYKCVDRSLEIYLKALTNTASVKPAMNLKLLRIGALSKVSGANVSTLRYWVKMGLIEVVSTTDSGYQLFAPETVERIKKIRKLQEQRRTLKEILETLDL